MNTKKKLIIGLLFLASLFILIVSSLFYGGCGLDEDYAKSKVAQHLKKKGKSIEFLRHDSERSSYCNTAFIYENGTDKIYFSVINGGKVTWWDVKARGEL